jgi:hypothetical protein
MTNLHLFPPSIGRSEFGQPSNFATSYAEGGRSEVNRVTQSRQRGNSRHAQLRRRGFSLTIDGVLFNRRRASRTVK